MDTNITFNDLPIQELPGGILTNKIVIFLNQEHYKKYRKTNFKVLHHWICQLKNISRDTVKLSSLISKIHSTNAKYKILRRRNIEELEIFSSTEFILPVDTTRKRNLNTSEANNNSANKKLKFEDTNNILRQLVKQHYLKTQTLKAELLKTKTLQHTLLKREIQIKRLKDKNASLKNEISSLRQTNKNLQSSFSFTTPSTEYKSTSDKSTQCNFENKIITEMDQKISTLEDILISTETHFDENNNEHSKISLRDCEKPGYPYSPNIRQLYYEFLSRGVSCENIGPLIKLVVNILMNCDIGQLPSQSTAKRLTLEAAEVSRQQICEVVNTTDNLSLQRDATTKKGHHLYGLNLSSSNNTYTIGVREVSSETAHNLLQATITTLDDLEKLPENSLNTITKISSSMTDRSATENKVTTLLQNFKCEQLKTVKNLSETEKKETSSIHQFHCSVHPLLQFSDQCEKITKEIENEFNVNIKGIFCNRGDSFTLTMLRLVSKLFFKDGSGDPLLVREYLLQLGIKNIPILDFKGNRFNVLFYNAAGTYYLSSHLCNYLQSFKLSLNPMQNSLLLLLQNKTIMSICRVLGILYVKVTLPYWKVAASSDKTPLDLIPFYNSFISQLCEWSETPKSLISEKGHIFDNDFEIIDEISSFLFKSTENILFLESCLQRMCHSLYIKGQKLFASFINGGKYENPSPHINKSASSCPNNNIGLERLMAQIDRTKQISPNISIPTIESKLMYRNNKTSDWLKEKDETSKNNILTKARKMTRIQGEKSSLRSAKLKEEFRTILNKRKQEKENKKSKEQEKFKKIITSLEDIGGLWTSLEHMQKNLFQLNTKNKRIHACKCQINARRNIVQQKPSNKNLFLFSNKGKQHSLELLENNLKILIQEHTHFEKDIYQKFKEDPNYLVGKSIVHKWMDTEDNIENSWNGKILSLKKSQYQITYWKDGEDPVDTDVYELTLEELLEDLSDGNLKII